MQYLDTAFWLSTAGCAGLQPKPRPAVIENVCLHSLIFPAMLTWLPVADYQ